MEKDNNPPIEQKQQTQTTQMERNTPLRNRHWAWLQYFGDINTAQQSFQTYFELWVESEISTAEYQKYCKDPKKYEPDPIPTVNIPNAIEVDIQNVSFDNAKDWYIRYEKSLAANVVRRGYKIKAKVFGPMKLQNFPFDVQYFEIFIQLRYDTMNEPNWPYNNNDPSTENFFNAHRNSLDFVGWDFIGLEYGLTTHKEWKDHVHLRIKLQRSWRYYFYRVVVVMAIISFMAPFCFLFGDPLDTVSDRLGYTSTMLLTAVAYMLITLSFIPPLNYLTVMDKYIFFTFGYILFIALQISVEAVITHQVDGADDLDLDYILLGFDIIVWVIVHIVFIVVALKVYKEENTKKNMTKEDIDGRDDDRIFLSNKQFQYKSEYRNFAVYRLNGQESEEPEHWKHSH